MIELRLSGPGHELEWEPGETFRLPLPLTGRELEARVVLETEDLPRLKRAVPSSDPSARFVTLERYLKAGGTVARRLPSDDPRDVEGRLGLLAREIDVTLWHFEAATKHTLGNAFAAGENGRKSASAPARADPLRKLG